MFEIYEHNKSDCIKLLNMIICEIPFLKCFSDDCLLERLLNLISIITNGLNDANHHSFDSNPFYSDEQREVVIREWLLRHYNAKCLIDDLDFNDTEDRTRVTVLIINILFKLRHSLKDIEQYLKDCQSFVEFDRQLNDITRYDKLLEMVENDSNRWKSEARYFKLKYEETSKLIEKYQQNEIFNYNCNPRNQNLYKSRITVESVDNSHQQIDAKNEINSKDRNQLNGKYQQNSQNYLFGTNVLSGEPKPKSVPNIDVFYLCVECDQKYSTKFEYNLHVLKDHKHYDISQIICNSNIKTSNKRKDINRKQNNSKNISFKCVYNKCGQTFQNTIELRTHFIRHEPKITRILCINNNYTNAVLNRLRVSPLGSSLKARHLSNDISDTERQMKSTNQNTNIDLNFKLNLSKVLTTHHNYSNHLRAVPLYQNQSNIELQSNDSYLSDSSGEQIDSNVIDFDFYPICRSEHLTNNLKTYSSNKFNKI